MDLCVPLLETLGARAKERRRSLRGCARGFVGADMHLRLALLCKMGAPIRVFGQGPIEIVGTPALIIWSEQ